MKKVIITLLLTLIAIPASARFVNIPGLHPAIWAQKGSQPIKINIFDCTSPEWIPIVNEVVDEWNGAPFDLSIVRDPAECLLEHPGAIRIAEGTPEQLPYGGATWIYINNQQKVTSAVVGVLQYQYYVATEYHDAHWYLHRVMGHEIGNALTVGESGPHDDPVKDFACIMGYQDGVNINTPLDHSLLCQRYNCGR